ncbi:MAG: hypothetical protein HQL31_07725 [Planctomycetes bacterium]|nr:hypothetical protein [Planctomycetota bacterium]
MTSEMSPFLKMLLLLACLGGSRVCAEDAPEGVPLLPTLRKDSPATRSYVVWSEKAADAVEEGSLGAGNALSELRSVLARLRALPPASTLANRRFDADLQKLDRQLPRFLYFYGLEGCRKGERAEVEKVLTELRGMKGQISYLLPLLAYLERWPEYYSCYRTVLEMMEKYPGKVDAPPAIPPPLAIREEDPPSLLLDLLAIIDLIQQQGWRVGRENLEFIRLLASRLAGSNHYRQAISILELAKVSVEEAPLDGEIELYRKQMRERAEQDELY